MLILQAFENVDALSVIMSGAGGSIITMIAQRVINYKSENTDMVNKQVTMLNDVNEKLNEVVEKLQEVACYRKKCNERLNGENL